MSVCASINLVGGRTIAERSETSRLECQDSAPERMRTTDPRKEERRAGRESERRRGRRLGDGEGDEDSCSDDNVVAGGVRHTQQGKRCGTPSMRLGILGL